jgi:predicted nucleic acid-binding Zn ribbon protein
MAKNKNKKKGLSGYERRRLRTQQLIFIGIGVIIILSMLISLVGNI